MDRGVSVGGRLLALLLLALAALHAPEARASVEGTWRRVQAPTLEQHDVTDVAGDVTLTVDVDGNPVTLTGSVDGAFTLTGSADGCFVQYDGVVLPGETMLDGQLTVTCPTPPADVARLTFERCGCDDENAVGGDGCDATCQVEPCWSCVGDPSVCTPLGDGAACDDRRDCTTGTTCDAGLCGAGSSTPACVDLTGAWTSDEAYLTFTPQRQYVMSQRDGLVVVRVQPSNAVEYVGTIDAGTGAFDFSKPALQSTCPADRVPLTGVADATTYSATGVQPEPDPSCGGWPLTAAGTRNDPCTALPNGTACDDGDPCTDDDVCTSSVCGGFVVDDGTTCDDGNACTVGDTCTAGVCGGPPQDCGQCATCDEQSGCEPLPDGTTCSDGDACNVNETCTAGVCGGGEPEVCGVCETCDTIAGCVVVPDGTSCDDGSVCTPTDTCTAGTCTGSTPIDCGDCRACDAQDGCIAAPRPVCEAPLGNKVTLMARRLPVLASRPPTLVFKWKGGDGVTLGELGDPTVDERYTLCVFDESGPTPELLFKASAPPGSCGAEPCWIPAGAKGYKFKSRSGLGDGLTSIMVKPGAAGKASVVVKGKGSNLANRPDGMPAPGYALPLRVQFQGQSGACFGARFTAAGAQKNAGGLFKGKGQP